MDRTPMLGDTVRDRVSGFQGIVTDQATSASYRRFEVTSISLSEGRIVSEWLNEERLEYVPVSVGTVVENDPPTPEVRPAQD